VVQLSHKEKKKSTAPSPPKKEKTIEVKKERIKSNEYAKWDKFNVEEECKKIDEGELWLNRYRYKS
jgi:hypothetical protein